MYSYAVHLSFIQAQIHLRARVSESSPSSSTSSCASPETLCLTAQDKACLQDIANNNAFHRGKHNALLAHIVSHARFYHIDFLRDLAGCKSGEWLAMLQDRIADLYHFRYEGAFGMLMSSR